MKRMIRVLYLWTRLGMVYMAIEGVYRLFFGDGRVHIYMGLVGGLCALAVGGINQIPRFYTMPVILQSLIGTAITLAVEFASGCILNLWLGLGTWDYSGMPGNIMGQICPLFALIWFAIMPYAIWLEDHERFKEWGEGRPYTLGSIYMEWITGK